VGGVARIRICRGVVDVGALTFPETALIGMESEAGLVVLEKEIQQYANVA
jgi:hypothetical protein